MSGITGELALRQAWDESTLSFRTVPGAATAFEIELDHTDGDSVAAFAGQVTHTGAGEYDVEGFKDAVLYVEAGFAADAKIQVSPVDTGAVWYDLVTVTGSITDPAKSAVVPFCAKRIKVIDNGAVVHVVVRS
jgi:hypothetical protein